MTAGRGWDIDKSNLHTEASAC